MFKFKVIVIFILHVIKVYFINCDTNYPCNYHDTVDLTNSVQFENGSYLHDGVLIPKNETETFNYTVQYNGTIIESKPHIRGCICSIRPCIKWCCNKNQSYYEGQCVDIADYEKNEIPVLSKLNETIVKNMSNHFYHQTNRPPCFDMYALRPEKYEEEKFDLLEDGSIFFHIDETTSTNLEHCLALDIYEDIDKHRVAVHFCSENSEVTLREQLYAYIFWFSIPFMIATIFIYAFIPELRTLHGKSLICYLLGLTIAYTNFSYIHIVGVVAIEEPNCSIIGYSTYYFLFSAFFWLSIISFDLWWNFSGRKNNDRLGQRKRFILYSGYAWGIPLIFLIIIISIDASSSIPNSYKSGIGNNFCYLNLQENWIAMLYFYGPVLMIITFNITMFIFTASKIRQVQREMTSLMSEKENRKNLKSERNKFELFLRLFVIMGVTWIMDIFSYIAGEKYAAFFYLSDLCNGIQGFLIFVFFVLKRNVFRLCGKSYRRVRSSTFSRQFSKTSQYSSSNHTTAISMSNIEPSVGTISKQIGPTIKPQILNTAF